MYQKEEHQTESGVGTGSAKPTKNEKKWNYALIVATVLVGIAAVAMIIAFI